jgi:phosphoglycerate kinase
MPFPTVNEQEVTNKNVLVRADLEDDMAGSPRLRATQEIIAHLQERGAARIKVIGHNGNIDLALGLGVDVNWDLRADGREEANDEVFAHELSVGFDVYVNEAFATSHRAHASIVALPRLMKSEGKAVVMGLRFAKEIEVLTNISHTQKGILVIGGVKVKDKNKYAEQLKNKFSAVLRGGLLEGSPLRDDGLDITPEAVANYIDQIKKADLIVAAGVMGKYEDPAAEYGTKEVLEAIANSAAYKLAGGGDIEMAISKYGLSDKFDWISVGGGAMLEYLVNGTLPGIEALQ